MTTHNERCLYTVGYGAGWTHDTLLTEVVRTRAMLIDIRFNPWSKTPTWQRSVLQAVFGNHYCGLRELGNRNYRGGPILLVDPKRGAERVAEILDRYSAVILLCGCRELATCHRLTAAAFLGQRFGIPVKHLQP